MGVDLSGIRDSYQIRSLKVVLLLSPRFSGLVPVAPGLSLWVFIDP
jgi:hypothetical protein